MAIRGKNKNPYDELVGFCTVNRIGAKEEMRLRKIIDTIIESKLHQPTVISRFCEKCGNSKMLQGNGIIEPLCTCDIQNKT